MITPRPPEMVAAYSQSYACLVVVSHAWKVIAISAHAREVLGFEPDECLGRPLEHVFAGTTAHRMRSRAQVLSGEDPVVHIADCPWPDQDKQVNVTAVLSAGTFMFAFETTDATREVTADTEQVQRLINRVARKDTLAEAAAQATRGLRALTVMDRVSLHPVADGRLWPALGDSCGHPLDHPVPEDVLAQFDADQVAHAQYVPDMDSAEVDLLRAAQEHDFTPDLRSLPNRTASQDLCRALAGDAVRAAHVIPVYQDGALWGVFLCHHSQSGLPGFVQRSMIAVFATLFGHTMRAIIARETAQKQEQAVQLRAAFLGHLDKGLSFEAAFAMEQPQLARAIAHDGMALWRGDIFHGYDVPLTQSELAPLLQEHAMQRTGDVFEVAQLSRLGIESASADTQAMGALVVPMSGHARDMALFFRKLAPGQNPKTLWSTVDRIAADSLRAGYLEAQMRLSQAEDDARSDAQVHLLGDMGHRLRVMLDGVRAHVGAGAGLSGAEMGQRIDAMVAVHSQLAGKSKGWTGLQAFLHKAAEGAGADCASRLRITGDDVDLTETAFSTLAMVLHELLTNAYAHGALRVPEGRVDVAMRTIADGAAELVWTEHGGDPVREAPPSQVGLTLIAHAVEVHLGGTSDVTFAPDGLRAQVRVPSAHVVATARPEVVQGSLARARLVENLLGGGTALVLDDSLLVGMDAADMLARLGAGHVHTCNSVERAMAYIDTAPLSFALLDVHLAEGTSQVVAERLTDMGVPSVLATGFGAESEKLQSFPSLPLLLKPYAPKQLRDIVEAALAKR